MQASRRYAQRESVTYYEQALAALARVPDSRETREQCTDLRFRLAFSLYGLRDVARTFDPLARGRPRRGRGSG